MAFQIAEAFVRFFADKTQLERGLKEAEEQAKRTSAAIEEAVSPKPVVAAPAPGVAPELTDLWERLQAVKKGTQELAETQAQAVPTTQQTIEVTKSAATAHASLETSTVHAARALRASVQVVASELNPALGQAASGLVAGASAFRAFGIGAGLAVTAAITIGAALGLLISKLREARDLQVSMTLAIQSVDVGQALSNLEKLREAEAQAAQRAKDMAETTLGAGQSLMDSIRSFLRGTVAAVEEGVDRAFGPDRKAQIERARQDFLTVFTAFEIPQRTLQNLVEYNKAQQRAIALDIEQAESTETLNAAYAAQAAALDALLELNTALLRSRAQQEAIRLGAVGAPPEAVAQPYILAEQQIRTLQRLRQEEAREAIDANAQKNLQLVQQEADAAARILEIHRQRVRQQFDLAEQELVVERQFAQLRAEATGIPEDTTAFFLRTRDLARARVDAEREALDEMFQLRRQALEQQIELQRAARGVEPVALTRELRLATAQYEADRVNLAEQAELRLKQLDAERLRSEQELNRQRFQLEQDFFRAKQALGLTDVQEELENLADIVNDTDRTIQERLRALTDFKQALTRLVGGEQFISLEYRQYLGGVLSGLREEALRESVRQREAQLELLRAGAPEAGGAVPASVEQLGQTIASQIQATGQSVVGPQVAGAIAGLGETVSKQIETTGASTVAPRFATAVTDFGEALSQQIEDVGGRIAAPRFAAALDEFVQKIDDHLSRILTLQAMRM